MTDSLGIYIHVPFCGKKCSYCSFYSESYSKGKTEKYIDAVIRNLQHYSDKSRPADTIYFGGGTPSLLSAAQIEKIINETDKRFSLDSNAEITIEANPCTLTSEKLRDYRNTGINRLSIGVQSLRNDELEFLGRTHNAQRAIKAVEDAANAGFENISCDLMIALPHQDSDSLSESISCLARLPIKHVSAYILKAEEGTPFYGIKDLLPDGDETAELYLETVKLLEENDFLQYEISNFAVKGFESRHNSRYWKLEDYIGIGPSAHSCCGGKRFAAECSLDEFISHPIQPVTVTDDSPCGFDENVMLRLRLREGLDISSLGSRRTAIEKKIPGLIKAGYAEFNGEILSLTPKGFLMSNSVISYLIYE